MIMISFTGASDGEPLSVGPMSQIRTDRPVNMAGLSESVAASFGDPIPTPLASPKGPGET